MKKVFVFGRRRLLMLLVLVQCLLFVHTIKADVYVVGSKSVGTSPMQSTSYLRGADFKAPRPAQMYKSPATRSVGSGCSSNTFLMKKVSGEQVHNVGSDALNADFSDLRVRYGKNNGLTYATVQTVLPNSMLAKNISLSNRDVTDTDENGSTAGPRRISGGGDGFLPKPPTPLGNGIWILMLFAVGYLTCRLTINYRCKEADEI